MVCFRMTVIQGLLLAIYLKYEVTVKNVSHMSFTVSFKLQTYLMVSYLLKWLYPYSDFSALGCFHISFNKSWQPGLFTFGYILKDLGMVVRSKQDRFSHT